MKLVDSLKKLALLHAEKAVVGLLGLALVVTLIAFKPWSVRVPETESLAKCPGILEPLEKGVPVPAPEIPEIEVANLKQSWRQKDEIPFADYKTPMLDLRKGKIWDVFSATPWPEVVRPKVSVRPEVWGNVVEFSLNYAEQIENCNLAGLQDAGLSLERAVLWRRHLGEDEAPQQIHEWSFGKVNINEAPGREKRESRRERRVVRESIVAPVRARAVTPTRRQPPRYSPDKRERYSESGAFGELRRAELAAARAGAAEHERSAEEERNAMRAEAERSMGPMGPGSGGAGKGPGAYGPGRSSGRTTRSPRRTARTPRTTPRTSVPRPGVMGAEGLLSSRAVAQSGGFRFEDTAIKGGEQYEYQVELVVWNPRFNRSRSESPENPRFVHSKKGKSELITAVADLVWFFTTGAFTQAGRQPWASCTVYRYFRYDVLRERLNLPTTPVAGLTPGMEGAPESEMKKGQWFKHYSRTVAPGEQIGAEARVNVQLPGEPKMERVALDFSTGNVVVDVAQAPMVREEKQTVLVFSRTAQPKKVEQIVRRALPKLRLTYLDDQGQLITRWQQRDELAAKLRKEKESELE